MTTSLLQIRKVSQACLALFLVAWSVTFPFSAMAVSYQECRGISDLTGDSVRDILCANPRATTSVENGGSVALFRGSDGAKIWELAGTHVSGFLGATILELGDLTGDGFSEFGVTDNDLNVAAQTGTRMVKIFSGQTRELLQTISFRENRAAYLTEPISAVGSLSVATLGLIDGKINFAIGNAARNRVVVYRGLEQRRVLKLPPKLFSYFDNRRDSVPARYSDFGWLVASGGDFDGDGTADLVVSAPSASEARKVFPFGADGAIIVYSGTTLRVIRTFTLSKSGLSGSGFGLGDIDPLVPVSDLTGDGVPELFVSAGVLQKAFILNGKTGRRISTLKIEPTDDGELLECSPAYAVVQLGDSDGDGIADLAVRITRAKNFRTHSLTILSGATRQAIAHPDRVACVSSAGDFNNDGKPDILVSPSFSGFENLDDYTPGAVRVLSGADYSELLSVATE